VTLRQGIAKHFTSALAVIGAAHDNHNDLMQSYAKFKRDAVTGRLAGKFQRVVVVSDDVRPLVRLRDQLARGGVASGFNDKSFSQDDANDYWTGKRSRAVFPSHSLVVDMAQPQGPVAKALLEPQSDFEPEFFKAQQNKKNTAPEGEVTPGPEGTEFYDLTGWALPYAYELKAYWCESAPHVTIVDAPAFKPEPIQPSSVGYVLPYRDDQDALAALDLLEDGVKVSQTSVKMSEGGKQFARGAFLILSEHNEPGYEEKLTSVSSKRLVNFEPLETQYPDMDRQGPGSESVSGIKAPKIGVVFGNSGELTAVGAVWFLFERTMQVPFTPLTVSDLSENISDFTCIIVPSGTRITISQKLRDWVNGGGSLVVLDKAGWAIGSGAFVELDKAKGDPQDLPGSLFRAELDPRSFLSNGYYAPAAGKIELAVPVQGSGFYSARKEGGSVVAFSADANVRKLLTGWEFEDDTEKNLAGTVWLQDTPVGQGHVMLFTQDPTERAIWPGLNKMMLNAILAGR
jgi:hypothetical protein